MRLNNLELSSAVYRILYQWQLWHKQRFLLSEIIHVLDDSGFEITENQIGIILGLLQSCVTQNILEQVLTPSKHDYIVSWKILND
jgi:hypothetical protein